MATSDTGFQFRHNLAGRTTGIQRSYQIENSATITVGDMVRNGYDSTVAGGGLELAAAGNPILGVVVGIVDRQGIDLDNSRLSKSGTWTSSTKTYVAASDNETVDKVQALVDIDPMSVWSAQPDAAIGTTTSSGSSDQVGGYTDIVAASDQPDENNAGNAFNVKAQLFIWGVDPENTARGLYSIAEHQIWGG
jgi:hypothetical protein